jgi:thiol:disulfide interchange protein DsbD
MLIAVAVLWPLSSAAGQMRSSADFAEVSAALNVEALQPGQQAVLAVVIDVEPGHYVQAHEQTEPALIPLAVEAVLPAGVTAGEPQYPIGIEKTQLSLTAYAHFGRAVVYVPLTVSADAQPGPIEVSAAATFQICDDATQLCYPPTFEPVTATVATTVVPIGEPVAPANGELFADFDPAAFAQATPEEPEPAEAWSIWTPYNWVVARIETGGVLFVLPAAFLAGMIFNVVPCVLPVLPLKIIGFFEAAQHDRLKCVSLSLAFAAGMVGVFAGLGVLIFASSVGLNWGELFSYWWFSLGLTVLLILAAVGTFGGFDLSLPGKLYQFSPRHDTYVGNAQWGAFTALLSTPCTFGLFTAAMVWAAAQPPWLGVAMMVITGVGMAAPYVVLSFYPELARRMPAGGGWGEAAKQATAFLILAVAAFFAKPLIPDPLGGDAWWWVVFALLAAGGAWLIVRGGMLNRWKPLPVAIAAAVVAVLLVPSALLANRFANPPAGWVDYSDAALAEALDAGGSVVVKFTADWCLNCQVVERQVFGTQPQMDAWRDAGATLIKADLTSSTADGWVKLAELNPARAIPFTAVYVDGDVTGLGGIYSSEDLRAAME